MTSNRVTLSDGSVWEKMDGANIWICEEGRYAGLSGDLPWPGDHLHLTASDHRAIADVLDRTVHPEPERA
jgi:hypothetical protein